MGTMNISSKWHSNSSSGSNDGMTDKQSNTANHSYVSGVAGRKYEQTWCFVWGHFKYLCCILIATVQMGHSYSSSLLGSFFKILLALWKMSKHKQQNVFWQLCLRSILNPAWCWIWGIVNCCYQAQWWQFLTFTLTC